MQSRKIDKSAPNGCWLWTGFVRSDGYVRTTVSGVRDYVHRHAFRAEHGAIPDGLVINHLCSVRSCCNPSHLEAVTQRENIRHGKTGETTAARNVLRSLNQTHCKRGHEFTPENTHVKNRKRHCRACRALAARQRRKRASNGDA